MAKMTYDQFQAKYLGKAIDYDGTAGVQCVDLFDQYLKDCFGITGVWVTAAREIYTKFTSFPALVQAFVQIPNTRELTVRKGDIVIWGGGTWGHVGIGTGEGTIDWFTSIEENTLGRHEPTQKVKHYFNGSGGSDCCNPVLGVLRPKQQSEELLDSGSCYRLGETTVGALAVKEMLRLAKQIKLHSVAVTDTKVYDQSAVDAVKALQKRWGFKQTGRAGENFVRRLAEALK